MSREELKTIRIGDHVVVNYKDTDVICRVFGCGMYKPVVWLGEDKGDKIIITKSPIYALDELDREIVMNTDFAL